MPDTYSKIYLHYVCAVKYRRGMIRPAFEGRLYSYMAAIVAGQNQTLIRINGMPDHVHMLVRLRPAMAPAKLIQLVKQNSSRWINDNDLCPVRFNWQHGGGVFSVSRQHVEMISGYIDKQKRHHKEKGQSFKEEYLQLLKENGLEFDEKYSWEFFDIEDVRRAGEEEE